MPEKLLLKSDLRGLNNMSPFKQIQNPSCFDLPKSKLTLFEQPERGKL